MVVLNKIYTRTGDAGETALSDGSRLAQWGEAARQRVAENFRLEGEAARIVAVYRELLAR